jgi:dolichol-phosphate mannosyltransferase
MNFLTNVKQSPTGADVALIDRVVIEALKDCNEKNASNNMLVAWLGFPQTSIEYVKEKRYAGYSKWTFSKRIKLFIDSMISFSYLPLRAMSLMGIFFSTIGLLFSIRVFYNAIVKGSPVSGWPSLMIVTLFIGGFQMIMLGLLGEYLWRTYDETRARPKFVIEKNTLVDSELSCSQESKSEETNF